MLLLLSLLAGIASGLRSLTPAAIVAWGARLGALDLAGTPLSFMSSNAAVASFTVLAIAELVFDKLPFAPNRTEVPGLVARLLLGALAGGALAVSTGSALALGASVGAAGGLAGTSRDSKQGRASSAGSLRETSWLQLPRMRSPLLRAWLQWL